MKAILPTILIWTGMVAIVIGLVMPLFTGPQDAVFRWVFGAGAALNLVGRLFSPYTGSNIRVKRLVRIELWAALFFCVATYFMFYGTQPSEWIVFVLAGGAILTYTSIMIPIVQRKK
ncbi:MAG: hypothetical protein K2K84_08210 [Muribaculaceae bacterium]|nr:hypothetical protein [Muribaculaceae bacterium]